MARRQPQILTAEQVVTVDDRPERVVEVPEWGGAVRIKALSLGQFQDIRDRSTVAGEVDETRVTLYMLQEGIVEPRLTEAQVEMLRLKSIPAVVRLLSAISELSAVDEAAQKAAEARFPGSG